MWLCFLMGSWSLAVSALRPSHRGAPTPMGTAAPCSSRLPPLGAGSPTEKQGSLLPRGEQRAGLMTGARAQLPAQLDGGDRGPSLSGRGEASVPQGP